MWWFGSSLIVLCGDDRSSLLHESISAAEHGLRQCRASILLGGSCDIARRVGLRKYARRA